MLMRRYFSILQSLFIFFIAITAITTASHAQTQAESGLMTVTTQPILYGRNGVFRTKEEWQRLSAGRESLPTTSETTSFVLKDGNYLRVNVLSQGDALAVSRPLGNKTSAEPSGSASTPQLPSSLTAKSLSITLQKPGGGAVQSEFTTFTPGSPLGNFVNGLNSQGVAYGIVGLIEQQKNHQVLAEMAMRSYQESSSFFGKSAEAIRTTTGNIESNNRKYEANGLGYLAEVNRLPTAPAGSTEEISKIRKLHEDPLAVRTYQISSDLEAQIRNEAKVAISKRQYAKAAYLIEQVSYNSGAESSDRFAKDGLANKDLIIEFEKHNPQIPRSPFSGGKLQTDKNSGLGQITRRVANRYQSYWADTNGLSRLSEPERIAFLGGVITLRLADQMIAGELLIDQGAKMLVAANDLLFGLQNGFTQELVSNLEGLVNFIPNMAHAINKLDNLTLESSIEFISSLSEVPAKAYSFATAKLDQFNRGSAYEKGQILGQCLGFAAVMIATDGVAGELKVAAMSSNSFAAAQSMIKATRIIEGSTVSRAFAAAAPAVIGEQVTKWGALIEKTNPQVKDFMTKLVSQDAYLKTATGMNEKLSEAGWQLTEKKYQELALRAESISTNLKSIQGIEESATLTRGLRKEYVEANIKDLGLSQTEAVFATHPSQITKVNRLTLGGELGIGGIYGSDSIATATAELGGSIEGYAFAEKEFRFKKLLDLTDPKVRAKLGVKDSELFGLLNETSPHSYEIPQTTGYFATKNGFDGIKYYSAPMHKNGFYKLNWVKLQ